MIWVDIMTSISEWRQFVSFSKNVIFYLLEKEKIEIVKVNQLCIIMKQTIKTISVAFVKIMD